MNKGFVAAVSFVLGAGVGVVAGKKLLQQHYEQVVEEEIESVKEAFRKYHKLPAENKKEKADKNASATAIPDENTSTPPVNAKKQKIDYQKYYPGNHNVVEKEEPMTKKPYVIPPDDFDTLADYEAITLKLYADGTMADDDDRIMTEEDIERTVTRENLEHIGDYEPDAVHVRNEAMHVDYEVLTDDKTYDEVLKEKPYLK